jgi:quercetin dioxygenase-like cupin family protein
MKPIKRKIPKDVIVLKPGQGRHYNMGAMKAIFKADEKETDERYSVSEWWLEPHAAEVHAHSHEENDEIFYVLEGTISFLVADEWIDASAGSFLLIPRKITHGFKNKTDKKAGLFNVFIPGGFERNMPSIVQWYKENKS